MPASKDIRNQVEVLTARWIELGFCDQQNPPVLRMLGHGHEEISIASQGRMGMALKNVECQYGAGKNRAPHANADTVIQ